MARSTSPTWQSARELRHDRRASRGRRRYVADISPVPEPGTIVLLGIAAISLLAIRRIAGRRRNARRDCQRRPTLQSSASNNHSVSRRTPAVVVSRWRNRNGTGGKDGLGHGIAGRRAIVRIGKRRHGRGVQPVGVGLRNRLQVGLRRRPVAPLFKRALRSRARLNIRRGRGMAGTVITGALPPAHS